MSTISLEDFVSSLPAHEQEAIARRADELVAEELTLRELRKAAELTQVRMAELLNISQVNVSRLEKRSDMLVSTLQSYVEALGGTLNVTVAFPGRQPIALAGLFDVDGRSRSAARSNRRTSQPA